MRVRDDQLAFRVGQQDRVGHCVDDAVEQHPLTTGRVARTVARSEPRRLLPEDVSHPRGVRHGILCFADDEHSQRLVRLLRLERKRMEAAHRHADLVEHRDGRHFTR